MEVAGFDYAQKARFQEQVPPLPPGATSSRTRDPAPPGRAPRR